MSWLLSDKGFFVGFLLFLAANVLVRFFLGKDPKTNKPLRVWWREQQERQPAFEDLEGPIEFLLGSGVDGASLTIKFPDFGLTVLFRKYLRAKGDYGLVLLFPAADDSTVRFAGLSEYCERIEIPFSLVLEKTNGSADFLRIDCGPDHKRAYELLKALAMEIVGIPEHAEYECESSGVARGIQLIGQYIDGPEQQPLPAHEVEKQRNEAVREALGYRFVEGWIYILMRLAVALGYLGLLYSLLLGVIVKAFAIEATWRALSFEVFDLPMRIKVFDLICVGLILLTLLELCTRAYWVIKLRQEAKDWSKTRELGWPVDRAAVMRELGSRVMRRGNILIVLAVLSWIVYQ